LDVIVLLVYIALLKEVKVVREDGASAILLNRRLGNLDNKVVLLTFLCKNVLAVDE
jgi:hypothetical protein